MKKLKNMGLLALLAAFAASARAADPVDLDALQTAIAGKFDAVETTVISGFVLGGAVIVGMITYAWVNRGARGKVK